MYDQLCISSQLCSHVVKTNLFQKLASIKIVDPHSKVKKWHEINNV